MMRFKQVATLWPTAVLVCLACSVAAAADWQGARLGFVGRMVKDLDRSVAFYKMIGFTQDPAGRSGLA